MKNININILLFSVISLSLFSCTSGEKHEQHQSHEDTMSEEMNEAHSHHHQHHDHDHHTSDRRSGGNEALSPPRMAMADAGRTHVHIEYNAPSVRDRVIWGELVPYDAVWVTGAHMATTLQFDNDLRIEDQTVPAGKYAFFTIPGEEKWTVILNRNWDQHLADDYDPELDVLRIEVEPEQHEFTEQLTFNVLGNLDGRGVIELMWEELKISIHIEEV